MASVAGCVLTSVAEAALLGAVVSGLDGLLGFSDNAQSGSNNSDNAQDAAISAAGAAFSGAVAACLFKARAEELEDYYIEIIDDSLMMAEDLEAADNSLRTEDDAYLAHARSNTPYESCQASGMARARALPTREISLQVYQQQRCRTRHQVGLGRRIFRDGVVAMAVTPTSTMAATWRVEAAMRAEVNQTNWSRRLGYVQSNTRVPNIGNGFSFVLKSVDAQRALYTNLAQDAFRLTGAFSTIAARNVGRAIDQRFQDNFVGPLRQGEQALPYNPYATYR